MEELGQKRVAGIIFGCHRPVPGQPTPVITRRRRVIQYAAAPRLITGVSGILDRPVEPGDDSHPQKVTPPDHLLALRPLAFLV